MNTVVGIAMPAASDKQLSDEQSRVVAALVLEELARRRLSRRRLADQAKISVSTLEKVLACRRPFTLATMVRLEEALGVSLRQNGANGSPAQATVSSLASLAPGDLGFYSRPSVSWLEGTYLTLRPSFGEPSDIYAYQTVLRWDDTLSSLIFKESERVDAEYSQSGLVSMPNQSGFVYLITNRLGQYRMVIISRPNNKREMFGIMTTLQVGRGSNLIPVSAPIAYVPPENVPDAEFGRIVQGQRCYDRYRKYLKRTTEEQFAKFLPV
ncbi:MAG TPA: transcriptional regulator [Xanthobacteraceae bacterium]|jgi:transcriptional regulator with XRE-family HTH domain|nr:transcriptional regulator [Xanthobacteraceae bacterium]